MKIKLTLIMLLLGSATIFGQEISKEKLTTVLKETLAKSRTYVSDATNSWFYDNTKNDYKTKDTLTFNTARSYQRDYCNIINWTFYTWDNFTLEVCNYCDEPPTKLVAKKDGHFQLLIEEINLKTILSLKNRRGIQDKFEIIAFTKNTPISHLTSALGHPNLKIE